MRGDGVWKGWRGLWCGVWRLAIVGDSAGLGVSHKLMVGALASMSVSG